MVKRSKLKRQAELQDKYCWSHPRSLPPGTVRSVATCVSDYSKQETILEWIGYNKDIYGKVTPGVWGGFLDYVEKNPDISIEELLNTFKDGHPLLQARDDQRFLAGIRLLHTPKRLKEIRLKEMARAERNKDALCWTCTKLDYDPSYEHARSQSVTVSSLWKDYDQVSGSSLRMCYPLPFCPVRGVIIHKGYKYCLSHSPRYAQENGVLSI